MFIRQIIFSHWKWRYSTLNVIWKQWITHFCETSQINAESLHFLLYCFISLHDTNCFGVQIFLDLTVQTHKTIKSGYCILLNIILRTKPSCFYHAIWTTMKVNCEIGGRRPFSYGPSACFLFVCSTLAFWLRLHVSPPPP